MNFLRKLLGMHKEPAVDHSGEHQEQSGSETETPLCDRCGCSLTPSTGYLLDVRKEYLEQARHELAEFEEVTSKLGVARAIAQPCSPVQLVCEVCLAKQSADQGLAVEPVVKLMSQNRAAHFWQTGKWERPMLTEDFPAESEENRLPWMNAVLEVEWKKYLGREPALEDYIAMRAATLCRCLAQEARQVSVPNNPRTSNPRDFIVVIAELEPYANLEEFFRGFIERRLLDRVGAATNAWFISYRDGAEIWFTHRMLPHVAIGVANKLDQNTSAGLEFECYIDNRGHHCMYVLG